MPEGHQEGVRCAGFPDELRCRDPYNRPHVHPEKAGDEGTHAGVGPLEELWPGGVKLDTVHALVPPASTAAGSAATEPDVLGIVGLACHAGDHGAVDPVNGAGERRLQGGALARAGGDGTSDLGRVAGRHAGHAGAHCESGCTIDQRRRGQHKDAHSTGNINKRGVLYVHGQ